MVANAKQSLVTSALNAIGRFPTLCVCLVIGKPRTALPMNSVRQRSKRIANVRERLRAGGTLAELRDRLDWEENQ
jgi:hypothetical protein